MEYFAVTCTRASVVLLGVVLLFLGCRRSKEGTMRDYASSQKPVMLGANDYLVAERRTIETGPPIAGSLEAAEKATLRAEVSGTVVQVRVDVGQAVKKGDLLGRIEATALQDAYVSSESGARSAAEQLALAEKQAERTRRLVASGALAERDLEVAESAVTSARAAADESRARVASARTQLENATLRAPMAGLVSERAVNVGDVVSPGTVLFAVLDPSTLRLEATVPSDALGRLSVGADVRFRIRGRPNQRFEGRVERVAPAVDPVTRQIPVLVTVPNTESKLLAGLFAEGRLATDEKEALVLPLSAIRSDGSKTTVLRAQQGRVEEVAIEVGVRDEREEQIEVLSGLHAGDVVLKGGALTIGPGTPVEVPSQAPPRRSAASPTPSTATR